MCKLGGFFESSMIIFLFKYGTCVPWSGIFLCIISLALYDVVLNVYVILEIKCIHAVVSLHYVLYVLDVREK